MKKNKRTIILIIIILISEMFFLLVIKNNFNRNSNKLLLESNKQVETKVNSAINTFNLVSQTIFTQIINNESVLKLYSHANNSNLVIKKNTRDSIYQLLLPTYKYLVDLNIRQLHFHLPNNESFLRFHRPNKYGDNLTDIRYSVKMANKEKVVYTGFEEGRIFNGFRYVFPLSYQQKHIGSVETSFSYEAINSQLTLLGIYYSTIALKKKIVHEKVFKEEQLNYETSLFSDDYVLEKKYSHYNNDSNLKKIDVEINNSYNDRLSKNENFSIHISVLKKEFIVSFISLKNIEDNPVGYIVTYEEDSSYHLLHERHKRVRNIGLLLLPFIILLIKLYVDKNTKVKEQNNRLITTDKILKENNNKLETTNNNIILLNRELAIKNDELLRVNKTKDKLFSIIAHDLRSPFNSILGFSDFLLENKGDNTNRERYLGFIHSSAQNTLNLLDNLLNWAKSQTKQINYQPEKLSLITIVNETLLNTDSKTKNISIKYDQQIDIVVYADLHMLKLIFRNLLSNAIKFTDLDGEIEITTSQNDGFVEIKISDKGIGMSDGIKNNLFQIGKSSLQKGTAGEKGSGLGLLLCKEFIETLGGKIWVKSELGKGSDFIFTIPVFNPDQ